MEKNFQLRIPADTEAGPNKAHKLNITSRQNEKTFYGQGWEKCVSKVWVADTSALGGMSGKTNLIDYLEGGEGNHDAYKDIVKWKVNGSEQTNHDLLLGNEPSDDSHRHFYIQVLPKTGGATIDRLIITVIPRSTKTNFDNWYATEKVDTAWLAELPNLFASITTTPGPDGFLPRPDRNFNPFLYSVPHEIDTKMHPNAYFEARSFPTAGGHAHQMCFNAGGGLLKADAGVSAGSADKAAALPFNPLSPTAHLNADVKPFVWALQLDGSPCDRDFTNLDAPIMHEGANLKKYAECRPTIANGKPILANGATP